LTGRAPQLTRCGIFFATTVGQEVLMTIDDPKDNFNEPVSATARKGQETHFSVAAGDGEIVSGGEPLGDHGEGNKSWAPPVGEQGVAANRPDDVSSETGAEDNNDEHDVEDGYRNGAATTKGDRGGTS
jgi:hypothetical protein